MTQLAACRNCGVPPSRMGEVLDLGHQRLSDFRETPEPTEAWPLRLLACRECGLVQLDTTVPRERLYHDGYGFHSGVNPAIRGDLADLVRHALRYVPHPGAWLDVACNDGTLLGFVPDGAYRVGVDPVPKFRHVAAEVADRVLTGYYPTDALAGDRFDVITASSVFYDLDDPHGFLAAAADGLEAKGVLVVQQNSLLAMLEANAYDNVSHEHLTYWSAAGFCKALERHGLEALDVRTSPVNGGVFRVVAGHRGERVPAPSVAGALYAERRRLPGRLGGFRHAVATLVKDLRDLVGSIAAEGERIMVYGASTRGAVVWQAAGIGPATVDAAVERNPEKVGRWYSAVGVPIISEAQMRADPPGWLLVGPWWLRDQVRERERGFLEGGGALVFPLPYVEVVRS